ncbi:GDPD-domain-containing protein [Gonapodya prolifera JEL478]|uniref:GDPD-domain-containing protein n=1 Tax=Gonapodya prolifera (strain JEL478) TaxID=1344416 RepID=A0A138ZYK6_GONPJ|nr:GDPD-domain-containing protein [Gonapodya prolifera JEL478]|eukprot:KXS09584.1 GDPD-domain-containing protein [Gonapodya prolifera JEL478]
MGDGADGETVVVPHTIQSAETARSPITLHAEDPSDVTLQFSIRPGFGQRGGIVGTAVAVLSSPGSSPWQERVPRGGSLTSPIVDLRGRVVGKVAFDFVVVDPWRRPEGLKVRDVPQLWKPLSAGIVGHRGLGMNRAVRELQLGENTIISFSTAGSLGAEFVEFDVQLTKDHKPVLYHDWSVTETGIDIAINQLSLEQFLALKPRTRPSAATTNGSGWNGKRRGSSDVNVFREKVEVEPKKHQHGLKGNSDGSVQGEFAKLEGAFKVGVCVEHAISSCGHSLTNFMYTEATMYDLHLAELNLYVDTILSCVFKHAGERRIIFSSFQPEACRMLRLKQSVYPVLFLTESGTYASADPRCNAMSTAVEFARSTGLDGIVTVADPVVEAPRLIGRARGKGLLVFTYGGLNNVVENVKLQRRFGADAVILDSLVRIRRGLAQENPHTALEASAEKRGVGWEI